MRKGMGIFGGGRRWGVGVERKNESRNCVRGEFSRFLNRCVGARDLGFENEARSMLRTMERRNDNSSGYYVDVRSAEKQI